MTKVMNQLDVNQDATTSSISHLAACGCVFVRVCGSGSRGPAGSPGRGELLRLSTLGALLLGETSLLLQLLVAEDEDALDTTKPGDRQPCREETDVVQKSGRDVKFCVMFVMFHWKTDQILVDDCQEQLLFPSEPRLKVFKAL